MADVTIRGAGIIGLSIAWSCAMRGARVKLIDPNGPGAGASGGLVGALAPHVPENWNAKKAFQLDSLLMAEGFWSAVEQTGGVQAGYARTGRLQPIADHRALDLARARAQMADGLWQGKAVWRVCATEDIGTWVPPSPTGYVIHDTLSARLHPRRACAALVAALAVRGVTVQADGKDDGLVIHATGVAGLHEISKRLDRPFGSGIKGQAALLRFAAPKAPQLFVEGLHFIPHADGTLAIGSTSERDFDDPTTTDARLDDLIDRARLAVPVLHGAELIERWAGVRPRGKSRAPVMGRHPLFPDQFIANGGFKIGFGMAPKMAEAMTDLILDGRDTIPEDFQIAASL